MQEECGRCKGEIKLKYRPMKAWGIKGSLCGGCYSEMIGDFYPGNHVRTGSQDGGGKASGTEGEGGGKASGTKDGGGGIDGASPSSLIQISGHGKDKPRA